MPPEAHLTLTGSHYASSAAARMPLRWLRSCLGVGEGEADHRLVQRLAGTVFMIRVFSAVLAFSSELDQWLDSRPVRYPAVPSSIQPGDTQTAQVQALLTRADAMLLKIESLLSRADETQQRLSEALEAVAERERVQRELRAARSRQVEAGAA